MNAKLDPAVLRATSAEHAIEVRRLELVDILHEVDKVPHPGGVVSHDAALWVTLARGDSAIVVVFVPGVDRVGVTAYYQRRYISYRESSREEAETMVTELRSRGFVPNEWNTK